MSPYHARTVLPVIILALVLCGVILFPLLYDNSTTQVQAVSAPGQVVSKKYIAFRDDDVASTSNLTTLKAVNDVHVAHNVPVTLGIVPHPYPPTGNELTANPHFLAYAQSIEASPLFEFAQHGYTHRDNLPGGATSELYGQSYDAQLATLRAGQADMREAFGLTPTTFIPPFNTGDATTLRAVATLGFKGYSAGEGTTSVTRDGATGLVLSGVSVSLDGRDLSAMITSTEGLLTTAPSGSTIVVQYHVWSFTNANGTVNTHMTQTLGLYMDYLTNRGDVGFVRLDHVAERGQLEHAAQTPWVSTSAEDVAT